MKIEKIDDNSIRCTLSSLDLSSRNINLRDMTYGSQAAKRLFNEMMQKAQEEVGFVPDSTPLMIEAIPLQGGSIQLIITKVDDPEELDTRFSHFTKNLSDKNGWISQLASQILEGAHDLMRQMEADKNGQTESETSEASGSEEEQLRIFRFQSLERVCEAAEATGALFTGENALYKDEKNRRYYLVLHAGEDKDSLNRTANLLSEYGEKLRGNALNEAYYEEHMETLIAGDALQKLGSL